MGPRWARVPHLYLARSWQTLGPFPNPKRSRRHLFFHLPQAASSFFLFRRAPLSLRSLPPDSNPPHPTPCDYGGAPFFLGLGGSSPRSSGSGRRTSLRRQLLRCRFRDGEEAGNSFVIDELYNFVVANYSIWNHFLPQNSIWGSHILKFKFRMVQTNSYREMSITKVGYID